MTSLPLEQEGGKHHNHEHEDKVRNHHSNVITHKTDGTVETSSFRDIFKNENLGLTLRVLFKAENDSIEELDHREGGVSICQKEVHDGERFRKVATYVNWKEKRGILVKKAKIKCSADSKFLAIFMPEVNTLKLFRIDWEKYENLVADKTPDNLAKASGQALTQLLDDIEKDNYYMIFGGMTNDDNKIGKTYDADISQGIRDIKFVKRIYFDEKKEYMLLVGENQVLTLSYKDKNEGRYMKEIDYWSTREKYKFLASHDKLKNKPAGYYERIYDARLESQEGSEDKVNVQLALKVKGQRQIDIIDISRNIDCNDLYPVPAKDIERSNEKPRQIIFLNEISQNFSVKISKGFKKVVLVNKNENYMLETRYIENRRSKNGEERQRKKRQDTIRKLPQLNGQIVRYISLDKKGDFYLVACFDYDQSLDIVHTASKINPIMFDINVEPGILRVYDFQIDAKNGEAKLSTICTLDGGLSLDTAKFNYRNDDPVDIIEEAVGDYKGIKYFSEKFSAIHAFCSKWPYSTFSGLKSDFIMILNAFDRDNIHRVQLHDEPDRICKTYITDTNDLFIMVQKGEYYRLQYIDLDAGNVREQDKLTLKKKQRNQLKQNSYNLMPLFEFNQNKVDSQQLLQMHIRGSSGKEVVDNNEHLVVYLLHQDMLYCWTPQTEVQQQMVNRDSCEHLDNCSFIKIDKELKTVCKTPSNDIATICDGSFLVLQEVYESNKIDKNDKNDILFAQEIVRYTTNFIEYEKKVVHRDYISNEFIINFEVDQELKQLLIFSKSSQLQFGKQVYLVKLKDMILDKVIYSTQIQNPDLIGRLESGLYTLVDGHCYFSNHVYKIRYDLIQQKNSSNQYTENQIFDYYKDIFQLNEGEHIQSNTPIDSIASHKFIYVISNPVKNLPTRILMLPYLHEKRVYLNRYKQNTEYFYTTAYQNSNQLHKQDLKSRNHYQQLHEDLKQDNDDRSIICINLSESKYYSYSQRGLLRNRINFKNITDKYGQVIAISQNGLNLVLMKERHAKGKNQSMVIDQSSDSAFSKREIFLTVYHLTEYEFLHIKKISLFKELLIQKDTLQKSVHQSLREKRQKSGRTLWMNIQKNDWIKDAQTCDMIFKINDNFDIVVEFKRKGSSSKLKQQAQTTWSNFSSRHNSQSYDSFNVDDSQQFTKKRSSLMKSLSTFIGEEQVIQSDEFDKIYFFIGGKIGVPKKFDHMRIHAPVHQTLYNDNSVQITKPEHKFVYLVSYDKTMMISANDVIVEEHKREEKFNNNFIISNNYIIFWNRRKIWCTDITTSSYPIKSASFMIEGNEHQYIKDIRVGSHPSNIALIINQSLVHDCIITWNLQKNAEKEAFDISGVYVILWDDYGDPYIIQENRCIFTANRCSMLTYDEDIVNLKELMDSHTNHPNIHFNTGHRFDGLNHNWLILNEYICMSFSYMCFVIKDKIENEDLDIAHNVFDQTPYNFIFNRQTPFTDGEFVKTDHELLQEVCNNLLLLNPELLSQLHYTRKQVLECKNCTGSNGQKKSVITSALHSAMEDGNNRSVDLILQFISKTPMMNTSRFFRSIFDQLVDQTKFPLYLKTIQLSSYMIAEKQTLRVAAPYDEEKGIVKITDSNCIYLDETFYRKKMDEMPKENLRNKKATKGLTYMFQQRFENKGKCFPVKILALPINWIVEDKDRLGHNYLKEILDVKDLDIYTIPSVIMLIEYLYSKFRKIILGVLVPFNIFQMVIFWLTIYTNEKRWDFDVIKSTDPKCTQPQLSFSLLPNPDCKDSIEFSQRDVSGWTDLLGYLNLINTIIQFVINCGECIGMTPYSYVTRFWSYIEVSYVCSNFILSVMQISDSDIESQRQIAAFVTLLIFTKFLYYLKLIDVLAPHINIIFEIFKGIGFFLLIFTMTIFASSSAFYLIGRNQMQFDGLLEDEFPAYSTLEGSIWVTWQLCLGNPETDDFFIGDNKQEYIIKGLFVITSISLLIHMLNMLIAIMGDIFERNNEVTQKKKYKDQLTFVVDKWIFKSLCLGNTDQIKYIICAFYSDEDHEKGLLSKVSEEVNDVKSTLLRFQQTISSHFERMDAKDIHQANEIANLKDLVEKMQANKH